MKHLSYTLLGGAGLLALAACGSSQKTVEQTQPNVIYVFPDQFRNMALGIWNEPEFKEYVRFEGDPTHTPNLNRFAKESLVLSSAMSNCPLSSPHRGSLLTGMYPNKSGIPLNCNSDRPISSLRTDVECVSDVFSKNGYECAYFGKLHADFPTPNDPANPGHYVEDRNPAWDAYTPKERRHGFNYWYSYGTFDEHKNPHYWDTEGKRHDPKEWSPIHEAKQVISYLKNENGQRDASKPFFIMVGMNPPHILDCLKELNLDENTIVVFASDHGETMCSQFTDDPKNSPYAESMNIPFIVRYPGHIRPHVDSLLLSSPDIMPTLLGLCKLDKDIPATVQGSNYAPLFFEDSTNVIARPTGAVYIQNIDGDKDKDGKVISYFPKSRGIKTAHYTLALYIDKDKKLQRTLLFDDINDPYQLKNLSPEEHPEIVKELYKELAQQLKDIEDPWYNEKILSEPAFFVYATTEITFAASHCQSSFLNLSSATRLQQSSLSAFHQRWRIQ